MKSLLFSNLKGYKPRWIKNDVMAALVVTAIAIPESLGFAVIVGVPVQVGLYCALLAPIVFAAFTSSKRLVVGADSATAALVASGAAVLASRGTPEYANAIAILGLVTGGILLLMSILRFGFLANLISKPVLVGFISGVGVQLLLGKLPEMLGLEAHGSLFAKMGYLLTHLGDIQIAPTILATLVVTTIVLGWKYKLPGALIALLGSMIVTKVFDLSDHGIHVIGAVPPGLPNWFIPTISVDSVIAVIPAAFSIALVILAQSLAVIRNSAARHDEKVKENKDLMALGLANISSALVGGFAINGSPPRTSAGEMAGGKSQLINVIMALIIGAVLVMAAGLFSFVPAATLAAVVFSIGLHLFKYNELVHIWQMRRSEFVIAMIALAGVAVFGVQKGVMFAILISIIERLRRQYKPYDEVLLRDREYGDWALERFNVKKHALEAPSGLLIYRFNDAIFFENAGYFCNRILRAVKRCKDPVRYFLLDGSAINDIDYTASQELGRLIGQLNTDDVQFGIAHVSPRLRALLKRYGLFDLIGSDHIFSSVRLAIKAYSGKHVSTIDKIKALKLARKQYVVIGGAVLEMYGIRQTNDVDIVVSKSVYNRLSKHHWKEFVLDDGKKILSRSGYKIMQSWMGKNLEDFQRNSIVVNGIPVMGLEDIISCKLSHGRKKDLQDVKRIKEFMSSTEDLPMPTLQPAIVKAIYDHPTK